MVSILLSPLTSTLAMWYYLHDLKTYAVATGLGDFAKTAAFSANITSSLCYHCPLDLVKDAMLTEWLV
jgi:hypothetical protein